MAGGIISRSGSLLALLLAGCTPQVVYIREPLPLPPEPVLPTIQAEELACLSDQAYENLAVRDALRRAYAEQLRAIVAAHNEAAKE